MDLGRYFESKDAKSYASTPNFFLFFSVGKLCGVQEIKLFTYQMWLTSCLELYIHVYCVFVWSMFSVNSFSNNVTVMVGENGGCFWEL